MGKLIVGGCTNEYFSPSEHIPLRTSHNHVICFNQRNVSLSDACPLQMELTCETSPRFVLCAPDPTNPEALCWDGGVTDGRTSANLDCGVTLVPRAPLLISVENVTQIRKENPKPLFFPFRIIYF